MPIMDKILQKIIYFVGLFPLVMSLVTYLCWGQPLVGGG